MLMFVNIILKLVELKDVGCLF